MNEERFSKLEQKVSLIMENHLPHLQLSLNDVQLKMNLLLWVVGLAASAAIIYILNSFFKIIIK